MSRTSAVVCSLVLLGAPDLAGRGGSPTSQSKTVTLRGYPNAGAPATVTLLKPGTAPLRQLRYTVTPGSKTRINTTLDRTGSTLTVDRQSEPTAVVMKIVAEVSVRGVAANGDITHDVTLVDYTIEPDRGTTPIRQDVLAARGVAVTSDRGVARSMEWQAASNVVPVFTSLLEDLSVPFPEEPVGVGARWEVRQGLFAQHLVVGAPTLFQRTEYELVAEDAGRVSVKFWIKQTAPVQTATMLGGEPIRIPKLFGAGAGTAIVHLNSHLPQRDQIGATSLKGRVLLGAQSALEMIVTAHWYTRLSVEGASEKWIDARALRGIKAANVSGTANSRVGPERLCYPRSSTESGAGGSIALGSLLEATNSALAASGIESTPKATDRLLIDAQIHDAAECSATVTLEFLPSNTDIIRQYFRPDGSESKGVAPGPAAWRRTFVVTGAPAGFPNRVVDALRLIVKEFGDDLAAAR